METAETIVNVKINKLFGVRAKKLLPLFQPLYKGGDDMNEVYIAIISSISTIILTYIKIKYDMYKNREERIDKKTDLAEHKIKNHIFFTMAISYKGDLYSKFILKNKGKETIFRYLLYYSIKIFETNFKIIANKIDNGNINIDELKEMNINAIEKSYRCIRELYERKDLTEDERISLKIVTDKFITWNQGRYNRLRTNVINVGTSEFYNNPISMEASILDLVNHTLYDMIDDAIISFDTINGDLNGLVFKGMRI